MYITDDAGSHTYEIFAAYEVSTEGDTYRLGFRDDGEKQAFIDYCLSRSVIETGVTPQVYDRILTLSTCTGRGHDTRWVVQAVLRGEAPPEPPLLAALPQAPGALRPAAPPAPPSGWRVRGRCRWTMSRCGHMSGA